jgi:tetratricopeptide (TPR) repeat protein
MDNLANNLSELGQYAEAEQLEKENFAYLRGRGEHDTTAAGSACNLACIYARQGRTQDALAYLRQAVDIGLAVHVGLQVARNEDLKSLQGDPRFAAIAAEAHKQAIAEQTRPVHP